MKIITLQLMFFCCLSTFFIACGNKLNTQNQASDKVKQVNSDYFSAQNERFKIDTVDCTLSNGVKSKCLQITTKGFNAKHKMGPWCPESITDTKDKGGLWFKNGQMYDVDGEFIQNLATLYGDEKWLMYEEDGRVRKTKTKEDCEKLAGAQLLDEYTNFCIECLPSYVDEMSRTYLIPTQPFLVENPIMLNRPSTSGVGPDGRPGSPPPRSGTRPDGPPPSGKGPRGGGPSIRGIALNGIVFDAPAPVSLILSGYTIPPLDDAGGHVNMDAGYHYHATTGLSAQIEQTDEHAPLIGYAMDGIALYAHKNKDGSTPTDLDYCGGHYDETRGYHYHVDAVGSNNFINCFSGAIAAN